MNYVRQKAPRTGTGELEPAYFAHVSPGIVRCSEAFTRPLLGTRRLLPNLRSTYICLLQFR